MEWNDLSTEIKFEIINHLTSQDDLKKVRLVCKVMRDAATRPLFSNLQFYPSMTSIRRLQQIGERAHLANSVKTLNCHPWGLEDLLSRQSHEDEVLERKNSWSSTPFVELSSFERNRIVVRLYSAYLDEIYALREIQGLGVLKTLRKTLTPFKHLRFITWEDRELPEGEAMPWADPGSLAEDHPLYLRTGAWRTVRQANFEFIDLCSSLPSQHLAGLSANFAFSQIRAEKSRLSAFRSVLNSIRKLDLSVDIFEAKPTEVDLMEFITCFDQVNRICDVRLALNPITTVHGPHINNTWKYLLRTQFPCLKRLTLEEVRTTEEDLLRFLKGCRGTLKSLTIENLHLLSRDEEVMGGSPQQSSSIHRFLWRLRKTLNLSELRLEGDLEDEVWKIGTSTSICDGLKTKFEDYVCSRRSSFPLEGLEKLSDEQVFHVLGNEKEDREHLGEWIEGWHANLVTRCKDDNSWHLYRHGREDAGHTDE